MRRFRGDAARGKSSGRDIFRFLIVEDVVKGSCLCSSRLAGGKKRIDARAERRGADRVGQRTGLQCPRVGRGFVGGGRLQCAEQAMKDAEVGRENVL